MSEPGLFQPFVGNLVPWLYRESTWWTGFGLLGNVMFSSRFILQWLYSEKLKRLVVPPIFWHQSFWGSLITGLALWGPGKWSLENALPWRRRVSPLGATVSG